MVAYRTEAQPKGGSAWVRRQTTSVQGRFEVLQAADYSHRVERIAQDYRKLEGSLA